MGFRNVRLGGGDSGQYAGRVIAFEAQEYIYYALCGNIALNNCFNVKAIFGALGNAKKQGEMLEIPSVDYTKAASFGSLELKFDAQNEFIGQKVNYQDTQKVPLISIDSLGLQRVDLIKIDVEKMELEVLEGAKKTIKSHKPLLIIEIIKSDKEKIKSFLKGYKFFDFGMNLLCIVEDSPILQYIVPAK